MVRVHELGVTSVGRFWNRVYFNLRLDHFRLSVLIETLLNIVDICLTLAVVVEVSLKLFDSATLH